ncbi:MAG: glycosyltransferase family 2 protein [Flavobacteriaceae bacterium]
MISVVIPLYNKEQFIAKALQSVLSQTYTNYEIIVVNDGSTDTSEKEVNRFKDARLTLITIQNSGVSKARNLGVKHAMYSWIAFLDADDWWAPTFLESMVYAIKEYPNHKVFATGRSRIFAAKTERYQHCFLPKNETTATVNYFKVISKFLAPINASNGLMDKELIIEKGLFREGMKQHEDHDLWIRICENNPVVFINKELSFYQKSITNSASTFSFSATDFATYVKTIQAVNTNLSENEKLYFKEYFQRFITIMYFKNSGSFSKSEKEQLLVQFLSLIKNKKYRWLIWFIHNTSKIPIYKFLKTFKLS